MIDSEKTFLSTLEKICKTYRANNLGCILKRVVPGSYYLGLWYKSFGNTSRREFLLRTENFRSVEIHPYNLDDKSFAIEICGFVNRHLAICNVHPDAERWAQIRFSVTPRVISRYSDWPTVELSDVRDAMSVYDIVWSRLSPYDFDENFSERITKVLATYTMKHTVEKCIEVVSRLKSGEFYCAVPITRTGFANIHRDETKQYKRIAKALGFDDILIVHKSNTTLVNSFFKCRTNHIESQDSFETIMNGLKM